MRRVMQGIGTYIDMETGNMYASLVTECHHLVVYEQQNRTSLLSIPHNLPLLNHSRLRKSEDAMLGIDKTPVLCVLCAVTDHCDSLECRKKYVKQVQS
ncbi:unnamed protein product [Linum tenue]|uniref:Uncharacterized protein n=1 Tax=Linum tenue TaxID=586396 RepID=A0AAV0I1R9_9ROSI|nr:unnamed protein product [Linum tenue]